MILVCQNCNEEFRIWHPTLRAVHASYRHHVETKHPELKFRLTLRDTENSLLDGAGPLGGDRAYRLKTALKMIQEKTP